MITIAVMKQGDLYCKAVALRGLPEFIRKLGGTPEKFFLQAGLEMADIKSDGFYDWAKVCNLFELTVDALDDPHLGMKFAHEVPTDFLNAGPMLLLAAIVPTMRDFFDLSSTYQKLHVNSFTYHYTENHNTNEVECEIRIHPMSPPCHHFVEHIMAVMILMVRHHIGQGEFKRLTFQHKAPADLSLHNKIFQCPIEFNANKNIAYMPLDFLDLKLGGVIGGRLRSLQPIVKAYLSRKVNKNSLFKTSMAHTVERLLPSVFGLRKSNIQEISHTLGISPKKLQRLLNDEGTTFSEVLDNVRKSMTRRMLFESDISIAHLAALLDYSSSESFNAACKRWFGVSPRQYRQILRTKAE